MLENHIGRSPKAWGLGQNAKICFPPARGAYFSIKCSQSMGLEGFLRRGRPPGEGSPACKGGNFHQFSQFSRNFVAFLAHLKPSWLFCSIFFDFSSIFGGFGKDLGKVLEGFFDDFSLFL